MSNAANPHTCNVCGEGFICEKNLTDHLLVHTVTKNFACSNCPSTFTRMAELRQHLQANCRGRPHVCETSGKAFIQMGNLQKHITTHTDEKKQHLQANCRGRPNVCETCGKAFARKINLIKHIATHTDEKKHVCVLCRRGFRQKAALQIHMRRHTGEKPYVCDVCGNAFTHVQIYNQHIEMHAESECVCDLCNEVFTDEWNRRLHVRFAHRPYACELCDRTFSFKHSLKQHIDTHSCNKTQLYGESKLHRLTHSVEEQPEAEAPPPSDPLDGDEKPHICEVCQKAFARSADMSRHLLTHTSNFQKSLSQKKQLDAQLPVKHLKPHIPVKKQYACMDCKGNLFQSGQDNTRLFDPPAEKPYICHICRRAFDPKGSVNRQTLTNDGKPNACHLCPKFFSSSRYLKMHLQTHYVGK